MVDEIVDESWWWNGDRSLARYVTRTGFMATTWCDAAPLVRVAGALQPAADGRAP